MSYGNLGKKKETEDKLRFYFKNGDAPKEFVSWINEVDGSLRIYDLRVDSIEKSKAICQWYLSLCDEL